MDMCKNRLELGWPLGELGEERGEEAGPPEVQLWRSELGTGAEALENPSGAGRNESCFSGSFWDWMENATQFKTVSPTAEVPRGTNS